MADNEYVNRVDFGSETLIDISDTTAEAGDVVEGQTFYTRSGAPATGTLGDATQSAHGLMSASDKTKLDTIDDITKTITNQEIATFSDSANVDLKTLKINIDAFQTGTGDPSPSNIRPIVGWDRCNIACAGKNLLDINRSDGTPNQTAVSNATSPREMNIKQYFRGCRSDNYYYKGYVTASVSNNTLSVVQTNDSNTYGVGFPVLVKPGQTYTLSADVTDSKALLAYAYYDNHWNYISGFDHGTGTIDSNKYVRTITIPDNVTYLNIIFRSLKNETYTYSNIQFELGDTATTYEAPQVLSYSIPLPRYGKNLFNKEDSWYILDAYIETDTISAYNSNCKTVYIECNPNTTYTVSKTAGQRFKVGYTIDYPGYKTSIYNVITNNTASSITITTGRTAKYLVAWIYNSSLDTTITADEMLSSVQFEQGSSATVYEPYINAGYGSVYDIATGLLTVNYGVVNLWTLNYYKTDDFFVYDSGTETNPLNLSADRSSVMCSCYKIAEHTYWTQMENLELMMHPTYNIFRIKDSNYSDVATFKAALQAANAQLLYKLDKPVTYITYNLPIKALSGVNYIVADTGNINTVTYYLDKAINYDLYDRSSLIATETKPGLMSIQDKYIIDNLGTYLKVDAAAIKNAGIIQETLSTVLSQFSVTTAADSDWRSPHARASGVTGRFIKGSIYKVTFNDEVYYLPSKLWFESDNNSFKVYEYLGNLALYIDLTGISVPGGYGSSYGFVIISDLNGGSSIDVLTNSAKYCSIKVEKVSYIYNQLPKTLIYGTEYEPITMANNDGTYNAFSVGANGFTSTRGSFAIGYGNMLKQDFTQAFGMFNEVSGRYGTAIGIFNVVSGQSASTMGYLNIAKGWSSTALGARNVTYGDDSFVSGYYNISGGNSNTTIGEFNALPVIPTVWAANTSYQVGDVVNYDGSAYKCITANSDATFDYDKWEYHYDYPFIIGNGILNNNSRSNALAVDWEGNLYLNGNVYVNCDADSTHGDLLLLKKTLYDTYFTPSNVIPLSYDMPMNYKEETLVGYSVAWNQLVDTNTTSVTIPSGHKYVSKISGTWSAGESTGTALSVTGGTDMVMDITRMFGTDMADAIYSLESQLSGAIIAIFCMLFPEDYYAYNAGEIVSVQVNGFKIKYFNRFNPATAPTIAAYLKASTYTLTVSSDSTSTIMECEPNTTYCVYLNGLTPPILRVGSTAASTVSPDISNPVALEKDFVSSSTGIVTYTTGANAKWLIIQSNASTWNQVKPNICVSYSNEKTNGEYAPYKDISYSFDSTVTLNGILQMDATTGKVLYVGDRIIGDGKITRYCKKVNLGDYTWYSYGSGDSKYFYCTINKAKQSGMILCTKFEYAGVTTSNTTDGIQCRANMIRLRASEYSSYTTTQLKEALDGVYAVVELTEPVDEAFVSFQSSYSLQDAIQEEFIVPAATSTTPVLLVGHDSNYYTCPLVDEPRYLDDTNAIATTHFVHNAISDIEGLPAVTSSDNGKVLRVVSGAWSAVQLPSASGVSF